MIRDEIYNLTKGRCYYCGCELDKDNFHVDHVLPKVRRNKDKGNRVPACIDCNIAKCDLTIEEFRQKIESLCEAKMSGRLIGKYYGVQQKDITFYFEEINLYERV